MIAIRALCAADAETFARGERAQGWHSEEKKFLNRLADAGMGKCASLVAEFEGEPAGYISVYFSAEHGRFAICAFRSWWISRCWRNSGGAAWAAR